MISMESMNKFLKILAKKHMLDFDYFYVIEEISHHKLF